MSLDHDIRLLSRVRLFEGFQPEHLRLIAFGAEHRTLAQGTRLYRQDTYSDGGYVIISGMMQLTSGPNDTVISVHSTGALIGELALITETNHAATATAAQDSEVLKIPRPLFRRMLEEYPSLAESLRDRISTSISEFIAKLETVRIKLDQANERAAQESKSEAET
ncbi:cyclic nucleotide-binding domain-containing protein [Pseudahrensia aquimaris]|uniref:Cyclic nucleotide-binding domain-containing protein n=1 Tax=Pseudahrensia aquimaris TaxID=744461 RepID=A0ABW3FIF8_9HYPH